ncbi:hypothetical protein ACFXHA_44330 [Nocardia sp. NPDC059240]|uniref:hypothetical protein n=1 Tax=Nocardia sp. NPDC059240 TaxID=3346786 RepID=UPI0036C91635
MAGPTTTAPAAGTTSVAPKTTGTPPITTTVVPVADLPMCGDVKGSGSAGAVPADCKLISHDSAGFSFIVRHDAGSTTGFRAVIDVTGHDGGVLQTIRSETSDAPGEPFLADLVGDGRDELIVPLSLAIVGNGTFEVFRPKAGKPEFARSGKIFGIGVDRAAGGYIVGQSKGGAAHWYIEFDKFQGSQLVFVAEIIKSAAASGSPPCAVDNEQGSLQSELGDAEILRRFCDAEIVRTAPVS